MIFRDGPQAVRGAKVDALLVDEADMGGSVAEYLGLPYISIACFPPLVQDDRIPPFCFGWSAATGPRRLRNRLGFCRFPAWPRRFFRRLTAAPGVGAEALRAFHRCAAPLAQIAQLPAALEFEVGDRPPIPHYTGPF